MTDIIKLLLGSLFGGMIFFPAIVAPRVFSVLGEDQAGQFLRKLFPAYYLYIIALSTGSALLLLVSGRGVLAAVRFILAAITLWVRQGLVPRINRDRDAAKAGDPAAKTRFDRNHRLSVIINAAQMGCILGIFFLL